MMSNQRAVLIFIFSAVGLYFMARGLVDLLG